MKFLEAKAALAGGAESRKRTPRAMPEHKMQEGIRADQRDEDPPAKPHKPEVISLAKELGVDLASVIGTGQHGAVLIRDVRAAKEAMDLEQEEAEG